MRRTFPLRPSAGFTLLEMSIVLVIVALIVGGIAGGEALSKAAELHHIESSLVQYRTAVQTFHDKYNYLPGDFPGATAIWGAADANPSNCAAAAGAPGVSGTCNGDGDGGINYSGQALIYNGSAIVPETVGAWQQLSLAGLIDAKLSGLYGNMATGVNVPYIGRDGITAILKVIWLYNRSDNALRLTGLDSPGINYYDDRPALSIEETRSIDTKLDDGYANSGMIYATGYGGGGGGTQCTGINYSDITGSDYLKATADFCELTWWLSPG